MDDVVFSHAEVISVLSVVTGATFTLLLCVFAWMGNKTYEKLLAIETLFQLHLATSESRFSGIEGRVLRVEDNVAAINQRHSDHDCSARDSAAFRGQARYRVQRNPHPLIHTEE